MTFEVFLSHSVAPDDTPLLAELERRGEPFGIHFYLAERDVQPGRSLSVKIRTAILRADLVVALLTKHGVASPWVNQEIGFAKERKRIVPLVEAGVKPTGIIAEMEQVRFDRDRPSEAFDRVTNFLQRLKADKEFWEVVAIVAGAALVIVLAIIVLSGKK